LNDKFDAVVLGAGISGLVSASVLAGQGCQRVLVVDEYDHLGGNHIDRTLGEFTFDVGSFIFQDDSPLLAHFPDLMSLYVPINPTFGRLNPQGVVTKYPISIPEDLIKAGPIEISRILLSVAYARVFQRKQTDARSFARFWIGDRLLRRAGLENYMERFYGVAPEKIDINFARKRMMWIAEHAQVATHVRRFIKKPAPPTNTQLARPREGFGHLYDIARKRLEGMGVTFQLGAKIHGLVRDGQGFQLSMDDRHIAANRVISTIPIPRAQELCGLPREDRLDTVTLISLFYSYDGQRGFPHSVLFNFSHEGGWKRLTMHSDFYGQSNGREYFGVEVVASHEGQLPEEADRDFRRHTSANRLFLGDLRLEGSHVLKTAYPIYTQHASARADRAITELRAFGVESFGRQGGFDYQPTARVSTLQAEASLKTA